jgi:imidazolonepropionase
VSQNLAFSDMRDGNLGEGGRIDLLVENIGQLLTFDPLIMERRTTSITEGDLGAIAQAWLFVSKGRVSDFGQGTVPQSIDEKLRSKAIARFDAQGGLVMPGLVDAHTHALFGGSRAQEFCRRLKGESYEQIAKQGGGIQSTVRATREAPDQELAHGLETRLRRALRGGITTIEVKSGYGLSVAEELRSLKIIDEVGKGIPMHLEATCLALHAPSPDLPSLDPYIDVVISDLLPQVAHGKLARFVDAFIEDGYYSVAQVAPYAQKALDLGLGLRWHADEFKDCGGAAFAAECAAASADHLQHASESGLKAMSQKGVVATLLPGTSLYTNIPYANGRKMLDLGVPLAIASDFNPGSCAIHNLSMLAALACLSCGVKPFEALAGVTFVPAMSLGLGNKGALAKGSDGDFLVYEAMADWQHWFWDFGQSAPSSVWVGGERVTGS